MATLLLRLPRPLLLIWLIHLLLLWQVTSALLLFLLLLLPPLLLLDIDILTFQSTL